MYCIRSNNFSKHILYQKKTQERNPFSCYQFKSAKKGGKQKKRGKGMNERERQRKRKQRKEKKRTRPKKKRGKINSTKKRSYIVVRKNITKFYF